MQIASTTQYDIGSSYSIRLNERESLVVYEDPQSKSLSEAKKDKDEKKQALEKSQAKEKASNPNELSPEQEEQVKELQARDAEVKAHEAAHQAAAGGLAGAASYTYQQGPDGKLYAIGGEVPISMPAGSSPEETLENARKIITAATAPGQPSSQDMAVASSAAMMQIKAEQQIAQKAQESVHGTETYKTTSNNLDMQNQNKQSPSLNVSA